MKKIVTSSGVNIPINYKPLYLGVQLIDKKQARLNLADIIESFDIHKIRYGLFAGTLLGAVREHDFIAHDEDVDLFVLEEDRQKVIDLLPELLAKGFEVVRYHRTGKTMSVIRKDQYTDFSFFAPYSKDLRNSGEWLTIDTQLTETITYNFLGINVKIPKDFEGYLECTYGEDWRIPIKWNNYEMPWWQRTYHNTRERIKEGLPSMLYFYIMDKLTEKKKNKFEDKIKAYCKKNGKPIPSFIKGEF